MGGQNYRKGRNFEYKVMKHLRKLGYYCIRAYASKGLFDIIAVAPQSIIGRDVLLIQAKLNGQVPKQERERLLANRFSWNGMVLIAKNNTKRHLVFENLDKQEVEV